MNELFYMWVVSRGWVRSGPRRPGPGWQTPPRLYDQSDTAYTVHITTNRICPAAHPRNTRGQIWPNLGQLRRPFTAAGQAAAPASLIAAVPYLCTRREVWPAALRVAKASLG
ncbi:hypothetical protein EVAR_17843_1 [Eumeta japonica]|uniref:Uncharacterized protein n=1 Tax=Eumeta variegata TaxID=151549 RepID=A0A4C1TTL7_EUMVA|nr:hypothetical protein EVAR_17843_1 [Eumeta japonica]